MASGVTSRRGEAGAAGCEYEACAGCGCGRDRGADGLDLVGDDGDGGFHAVLREKACGEGAGEVFSGARVAPVGDGDDARGIMSVRALPSRREERRARIPEMTASTSLNWRDASS